MFVCLCVSADVCATGVAVMRVEGLKVNSPCSSSRRSSPAALKMCSRGVPGNSLKDTKSGKLLIPCTHTLSHCHGFVCLTLSHTHCHISLSMIEGISIMLFWRESWGNLSLSHTHTHTHTHSQASCPLWEFPKPQRSWSAGPDRNLQQGMVTRRQRERQ